MILWREGRVVSHLREWEGALECAVDILDPASLTWNRATALAYPAMVGRPAPGEAVLLNTAALERGLGTGGYAMIIALRDRPPEQSETIGSPLGPGAGHLVKARYTPQQVMVLGVDEPASPHHDLLAEADDLLGMPVVVADLHSALPAVIAGVRQVSPNARVAYVMTDGAALPAWFSRAVAGLREAGWLESCLTTGQAFGGDLEAATLHTGLLAARLVVKADVTVVAQGPGVLGTGTRWGFSGVEVGESLNAAAVLGGRPIAALRISGADPRPRHRGLSHHSLTALGRVALAPCDVVVPQLAALTEPAGTFEPPELGTLPEGLDLADLDAGIRSAAATLCAPDGRHTLVEQSVAGLMAALEAVPVPLSTMGRGLQQDPVSFLAAAAAGAYAASRAASAS